MEALFSQGIDMASTVIEVACASNFVWYQLVKKLVCTGICMKGAVLRICPVCTSSSQTRIQPCQANKTKNSSSDLLLEAQHVWPAWAENACRRMSQVSRPSYYMPSMSLANAAVVMLQKQAGVRVDGPTPSDAAQMLQQLARSSQHSSSHARTALVKLWQTALHLCKTCTTCPYACAQPCRDV